MIHALTLLYTISRRDGDTGSGVTPFRNIARQKPVAIEQCPGSARFQEVDPTKDMNMFEIMYGDSLDPVVALENVAVYSYCPLPPLKYTKPKRSEVSCS